MMSGGGRKSVERDRNMRAAALPSCFGVGSVSVIAVFGPA